MPISDQQAADTAKYILSERALLTMPRFTCREHAHAIVQMKCKNHDEQDHDKVTEKICIMAGLE